MDDPPDISPTDFARRHDQRIAAAGNRVACMIEPDRPRLPAGTFYWAVVAIGGRAAYESAAQAERATGVNVQAIRRSATDGRWVKPRGGRRVRFVRFTPDLWRAWQRAGGGRLTTAIVAASRVNQVAGKAA